MIVFACVIAPENISAGSRFARVRHITSAHLTPVMVQIFQNCKDFFSTGNNVERFFLYTYYIVIKSVSLYKT